MNCVLLLFYYYYFIEEKKNTALAKTNLVKIRFVNVVTERLISQQSAFPAREYLIFLYMLLKMV